MFFQANISSAGANGRFANLQTNTTGGAVNFAADADTVSYSAFGSSFGEPGFGSFVLGPNSRAAFLGTVDLTAPSFGKPPLR